MAKKSGGVLNGLLGKHVEVVPKGAKDTYLARLVGFSKAGAEFLDKNSRGMFVPWSSIEFIAEDENGGPVPAKEEGGAVGFADPGEAIKRLQPWVPQVGNRVRHTGDDSLGIIARTRPDGSEAFVVWDDVTQSPDWYGAEDITPAPQPEETEEEDAAPAPSTTTTEPDDTLTNPAAQVGPLQAGDRVAHRRLYPGVVGVVSSVQPKEQPFGPNPVYAVDWPLGPHGGGTLRHTRNNLFKKEA